MDLKTGMKIHKRDCWQNFKRLYCQIHNGKPLTDVSGKEYLKYSWDFIQTDFHIFASKNKQWFFVIIDQVKGFNGTVLNERSLEILSTVPWRHKYLNCSYDEYHVFWNVFCFCFYSLSWTSHFLFFRFQSFFNLTMTYRRDSDFVVPYGETIRRKKPEESEGKINLKEMNASRIDDRKMIAWVVSHCQTNSQREKYVEVNK